MAAQLFSIHDWMRATGWLNHVQYGKILLEHGYNSYASCVNLSKADLLAAGVDDTSARRIADEVKELRAVGSEEDAVRELSVSVCSSGLVSQCCTRENTFSSGLIVTVVNSIIIISVPSYSLFIALPSLFCT